MKKFLTITCALLASIGFFLSMMYIKADVQHLLAEREESLQTRHQLHEDLRVLRAERAHVANLERLQTLAINMNMQPLEPTQLHRWETWEGNLTP